MAALWLAMTYFTKSPIEIMPTTFSPSMTGKCRMCFSVMRRKQFSTTSCGRAIVRSVDMISATVVSRERLPRRKTLRV